MDSYHITKKDTVWQLKKAGSDRSLKNAATKKEIISYMQEYMKGKTASVKIHKDDGTIQEERTYPRKSDPKKSKG